MASDAGTVIVLKPLRGTRCVVRPWRLEDAASLAKQANNFSIAKHLRDRFPHPYTLSHAKEFLLQATRSERDGASLAIDVDGQAAGAIGFRLGTDVERYSAEIGYWLGEEYWGRGIMTEALALVTGDLFERLNLLRLFAVPFADNRASARVLEKAGYSREAVLQSSCVKYGKRVDQLLYARVNESWTPSTG